MLNQKDILNLYKKYEVSASKRFGQNFLVNESVVKKIIAASQITGQDVVEIGPGLGSLTLSLLEDAKSVTSYEIDRDMIRVLESEINDDKFTLVPGDFLKADLDWEGKKVAVANIPYNITSDILFTFFKNTHKFKSATLMMQKEVAYRLLARVGAKDYGKLTLTTQLFGTVEKVVLVKPNSFIPAPKVDSMVVKINFNEVNYEDQKDIMEFIKKCFSQRRKTLYNNLKLQMEAPKAKQLIADLGFKESIRPQELTLEEFRMLFDKFNA